MSARIRPEEFLRVAQALPVGTSTRMRHNFERTEAMQVWNLADAWVAKCHRCGSTGSVQKEHVQYSAGAAPKKNPGRRIDSTFINPIELKQADWLELLDWLHVKLGYFCMPEASRVRFMNQTAYSPERKQIAFMHAYVRGIADGTPWMLAQPTSAEEGNLWQRVERKPLVLVEDCLSAWKIQEAALGGIRVRPLLGSSFSKHPLRAVVADAKPVVVVPWLDGDPAGAKGDTEIRRFCNALGIPCHSISVPGKDPKHLSLETLSKHMEVIKREYTHRT